MKSKQVLNTTKKSCNNISSRLLLYKNETPTCQKQNSNSLSSKDGPITLMNHVEINGGLNYHF